MVQKFYSETLFENEAKLNYKDSISSLLGGGRTSAGKPYLGDRFFDKDQDWHKVEKHKEMAYRAKYEPIFSGSALL